MSTLEDFRIGVKDRLMEPPDVTEPQIERAVYDAVRSYSRLRPQSAMKEYAGDGSSYDFTLPTDWEDGYSALVDVEYPAKEQAPVLLKPYEYTIYHGTAGKVLRLLADVPGTADAVRVTYLIPYTVSLTASTVPSHDEAAVMDLAASKCARDLAAKYVQTIDSTLMGDAVNYLSKYSLYRGLSMEYERSFKEHFGMKATDLVPAAGDRGDWDQIFVWGEDLLTHPRKRR